MIILYLVDFYKPNTGWIENLIESLANYFSKKHKVVIITYKFDKNLSDKETNWNITVYRISAKNLIFYMFKAYKFAKKLVKDIDIVHWNTFYSALVAAKLGKKYNKKTFIHIHGFFWHYRENLISDKGFKKWLKVKKFKFLEYLISKKKPTKFICVSRFVFDVLRFRYWVDFKYLDVVYNWVDYDYLRNQVDDTKVTFIKKQYGLDKNFVFSFVGRIETVKGREYYLEVIADLLSNEFANQLVKFLFIIFWDFEKFAEKMVNLKLAENTSFVENLQKGEIVNLDKFLLVPGVKYNQLSNWLKSSDVFVFPSFMESFWLIGLEASVLNVSIVASTGWAIPEVVFWNVNFFQEGNKEQLKQALVDAKNGIFYEKIPDRNLDIKNTIEKVEVLYIS